MRKFFILCAMVITAGVFVAQALIVRNTVGELATKVTDVNIKSLSVTGTMDVRDFKFISDSLDALTFVDLSGASIVAYKSEKPIYGSKYDYEAKVIPPTAFFGKMLEHVVLCADLKGVGYAAFAGCDALTEVNFPATLDSIGSYAFSGTPLTEVEFLSALKVGERAFSNCSQLKRVVLPGGSVGDGAFVGDALLSDVTLGVAVQHIGDNAFSGCVDLTKITWLEGTPQLSSIGEGAFTLTGITEADLAHHSSLKTIGDWAFAGTPVDSISLPESLTSMGDYALLNLAQVKNVTLPAKVTFIGTMAMAGMTGLQMIHALPVDVPALGEQVWAGVDQSKVVLQVRSRQYSDAQQWEDFNIDYYYYLGDVNLDCVVNVSDVSTLVNVILKGQIDNEFADINFDKAVNVSDVSALVNLILRGELTTVHPDKNLVKKFNEIMRARRNK